MSIRIVIVLSMCLLLQSAVVSQTWQSNIVFTGINGKLVYKTDAEGNRIPDFSYAGYKNGSVPIPGIAVVDSVSPISGDNTTNIQNAINRVALRPPDGDGFRGALFMKPGKYPVSGTLRLNASGIVLRGAGEGSDSLTNTIIYATNDSVNQPTVLIAGGGNTGSNSSAWSGNLTANVDIITDSVHVGERIFQVADASPFAVGDNIIIVHPKTTTWLRAIDFGGVPNDTGSSSYWASQTIPILYNRFITAINGSTITIDVPIFATMVRSLSQCHIYKTNRNNILTNIGIENLRVDIINPYNQSTTIDGDERHHAQDAIWLGKIEDAWVRHCTALHFVQSGFKTSIATRVTIDSCTSIDPISIITGERRYNFNTYVASQLILFSNCYAKYARHSFISNGASTVSGIVIYNCVSEESYNASEGHRLWSQGLLFDNFRDINTNVSSNNFVLGLYNRGNYGSGHGWASVHSVAWNCNTSGRKIIIQKPPTGQNYAIGCLGIATGAGPFAHPGGYIEGNGVSGLNPPSLYKAQLAERLSGTVVLAPDAPVLALPVNSASNQPTALALKWEISRDAATYRIQLATDSIFSSPVVDDSSLIDTLRWISDLANNTTYYWRVEARNAGGTSAWSEIRHFTTVAAVIKIDVNVTGNWNLLSVPSRVSDLAKDSVFPSSVSSAFSFSLGYTANAVIENGKGYWLKFSSPQSVHIEGTPIDSARIHVVQGWNLIGSISYPVAVTSITGDVPSLTVSGFFEYSNGYAQTDTIHPGKGYWVKVSQVGDLILTTSPNIASKNRIKISLTSELPPPPPLEQSIESATLPLKFLLEQNYPNPFNPSTLIKYQIPAMMNVHVAIYDCLGKLTSVLVDKTQAAGQYEIEWKADRYPGGVYFCRLQTKDRMETRKLVLIK